MTFRVGQKVVCVNAAKRPGYIYQAGHVLVKGRVYTIRETRCVNWFGEDCVRLEEIFRENTWPIDDMPYLASRFRPIFERKTDISFAHEILRKATKPARSPAIALHHRGCEL